MIREALPKLGISLRSDSLMLSEAAALIQTNALHIIYHSSFLTSALRLGVGHRGGCQVVTDHSVKSGQARSSE